MPDPAARASSEIVDRQRILVPSSLTLGADLDLTLQRGLHRGLMLFVRGDSTIEFEAGGSVVVSSDGAEPESAHLVPPEIVAVQTDSGSAVPIGIQTDTSEPLVIENLLVSRLAFTRALSAGGRGSPFVSSVVSGNVQLVDIARSETLDPAARSCWRISRAGSCIWRARRMASPCRSRAPLGVSNWGHRASG